MSELVSDYLLERLEEWGVKRIYGYPGDGINGILGALDRAQDRIEFVQARHEEMAAFMACAHAKFTGEVGVCMATSGPGRDPPAQRPLRRQARPSARRRDRRPAVAALARRQLPAGGRPPGPLQGRRPRVRAHGDEAGADPSPRRSGDADRQVGADRDLPDHPQRPAGGEGGPGAPARARHDSLGAPPERTARPARPVRPRACRRGPEQRRARRDARRRRRARCGAPRSARPRTCSEPASPRRCSARPCSPTTCPG